MQLRRVSICLTALLLFANCGGDSESKKSESSSSERTSSESESSIPAADDSISDSSDTSAPEPLRILVTDDDGVGAPAIDEMVNQLSELENVEITVVAPATNQSGQSDNVTTPAPSAQPATTLSGVSATAVDGHPADAVNHAIDVMGLNPHVVVSGTNQGQNIGPLVALSGTVGAARQAVRKGFPAVAASQGAGDPPAFAVSVKYAVEWVKANREALIAGTADATKVVSFNAPTCATGSVRGLVEVPVAFDAEGRSVGTSNCESTLTNPKDDIDAFINGYATQSTFGPEEIPPKP